MHNFTDQPDDPPPQAEPGSTTGVQGALGALAGDLKNPLWIYLKGFLFLLSGLLAAALLLI